MPEEFIKVSDEAAKKIKPLLEEKEKVLVIFPYGRKVFEQSWSSQSLAFDHLVVTNKRALVLKEGWFRGDGENISIPFEEIIGIEIRDQAMGCTVLIKQRTEAGSSEYNLDNCPKREGEAAASFLKKMMGKKLCPNCFKPIKTEFLFCPYCESRLKNTCVVCNKILESNWVICPYCGHK